MSSYDFTDAQVLNLVRVTHTPAEVPLNGSSAGLPAAAVAPRELVLICSQDYETWPCRAVVALREVLAGRVSVQSEEVARNPRQSEVPATSRALSPAAIANVLRDAALPAPGAR